MKTILQHVRTNFNKSEYQYVIQYRCLVVVNQFELNSKCLLKVLFCFVFPKHWKFKFEQTHGTINYIWNDLNWLFFALCARYVKQKTFWTTLLARTVFSFSNFISLPQTTLNKKDFLRLAVYVLAKMCLGFLTFCNYWCVVYVRSIWFCMNVINMKTNLI